MNGESRMSMPGTGSSSAAAHPADAAAVAACLLEGGVVLLPTDTVYGLAVLPSSPSGMETLYRMKQRPRDRNLPVMVADAADLPGLGVAVSASAARLLASPFMPGPLTLVLGFGGGARPAWLADRAEVAVRIPDDPWLRGLLRRCGPLCVTSANPHGQPTPETPAEILASLPIPPAMVVADGPRRPVPSTLVNCRLVPPVIERTGLVPAARLAEYLD